jgi:CRISPR-associated protein Cas1
VARETDIIIQTPGVSLHKTGKRILIKHEKGQDEIPLREIRSVIIHSNGVRISSDLLISCAKECVPILILGKHGRPYAILTAPEARTDTILIQIKASENEGIRRRLSFAFIRGKIRNQIHHLEYLSRRYPSKNFVEEVKKVLPILDSLAQELTLSYETTALTEPIEQAVFTREARASKLYWEAIRSLLPSEYGFEKRIKRGATDSINCFLNYGYGVLASLIYCAICVAGLSPQPAFLHREYKNRPALVFDLMEEFRPIITDKVVVEMALKNEIPSALPEGEIPLENRKKLLEAFEERLSEVLPYHRQKLSLRNIISKQVAFLVRDIKGESKYKPYIGKF